MKKLKFTAVFALSAMFLSSCGSDTANEVMEEEQAPVCFYSYNPESTELTWTAFKFNDKTPVGGTFTEINIGGTTEADDAMALLSSLTFNIPVATIESQNEERNGKIVKHFFETIGTKALTGKVVNIGDNGEATIGITMNNMTKEVIGKYTFVDNKFDFSASMDVVNWDAMAGIEALNTICKDLHTGTDGVSKLWSVVELTFSTTLKSDCN